MKNITIFSVGIPLHKAMFGKSIKMLQQNKAFHDVQLQNYQKSKKITKSNQSTHYAPTQTNTH